ncbi:unnamed protein product [Scytosiphon promiscuus]
MTDKESREWTWEDPETKPTLTVLQEDMLEQTISEARASPLCSDAVAKGGKTVLWRYLEGAQWRLEPVRGKRVSDFFLETLEWRKEKQVDSVLDRALSFKTEAASGKLFVRGTSLLGRPLIWVHAGRESDVDDPEANVQFLIYTVERAIASMKRQASTPVNSGQFCVVIDCSSVGAGGQLPSLAFLREAVSMLMLRYPSRLGNLFIVNSGFVVYYLWQAISLLLSPVTREKIVVVSGTEEQQREVLLGYISAEALEGGRLGCPGAPPFDADSYLRGGDAGGVNP